MSYKNTYTSCVQILSAVIALLAISTVANAGGGTDVGFLLGVKDATFTSSTSGAPTYSSEAGVMVGAIAVGELSGDIYFRSGGYFAQRTSKATLTGATSTITISYLDVPVTVMYKFNDMVGVFGGLGLGLKVSDSCSGDTTICNTSGFGFTSPNGFITTAQFGLNAKFHPNWSGELFYEMGVSDIATNTKASDISAALMFIY